ncbi:MAG: F0F1 ATP synthase subunit A [Planctomycetota bacterium]
MNYLVLASGDNPLTHVVDHPWIKILDGRFTLISNHVIMMLIAAVLLMLALPRIVRAKKGVDEVERHTPTGMQNLIETICSFLRDSIARPNMGAYTDRFIVYIWTAFFFVLTCNLLGLLPLDPITKPIFGHGIYGTATGNIWTTGTLALCTLVMIIVNGLRLHGMAYVKHFFMGPFPINLLIALLEVIGLAAKTFALCIRLFANMVAGHVLLAVLVSFIAMAGAIGVAVGFAIAIPVVLGSVAITLLEIFVAFLQAFIFTFLSCVFIGMAVDIHHEDHDEAGSGEHGTQEVHAAP